MVEIARSWGIDMSGHRSRPATLDLLRSADIILAATQQHHDRVIQVEPRARRKTFLIAETIGEVDIPDPYHKGGEMYRTVAELIRKSMSGWQSRLEIIVTYEFGTSTDPAESSQGDSAKVE
jgi:protein-tyrosine-phosphatase